MADFYHPPRAGVKATGAGSGRLTWATPTSNFAAVLMFLSNPQPRSARPARWWRRASYAVAALVAALAIYRVFAVDVFPVMTADSGHYVDEAISGKYTQTPSAILSPRHFKTSGYPLLLAALDSLADALAIDFLTLVPLFQRLLLAVACVWLALELRWAAIPLVLFLSSNAFVAQGNFVLTEGVTIPAGVLFALALTRLHGMRNAPDLTRRPSWWILLAILAATFGFLVLTKIALAAFAALLFPLAVDLRRDRRRRRLVPTRAAWAAAALGGLAVGYFLVICLDNQAAFGRLTPVIGSDRIFYWGLWEETFTEHPENLRKPELWRFYDRGNPYRFLHRVERECGGLNNFSCTAPVQAERARELAAVADVSLGRARMAAFFRGLVGGGKVELEGLRERVLASSGDEQAIGAWQDQLIRRFGERFNGGRRAAIVPGLARFGTPEENPGPAQLLLTLGLAAAFLFFALRRRVAVHGLYSYSLACYALVVGAFAFVLVDLWRYIAPAWAVLAVLQLRGAADAARNLWREGKDADAR